MLDFKLGLNCQRQDRERLKKDTILVLKKGLCRWSINHHIHRIL